MYEMQYLLPRPDNIFNLHYREIPWERVPYLSALEVCSQQGAIQTQVYLTLPYLSSILLMMRANDKKIKELSRLLKAHTDEAHNIVRKRIPHVNKTAKIENPKINTTITFHELQMMCTCGKQSKNEVISMAQ